MQLLWQLRTASANLLCTKLAERFIPKVCLKDLLLNAEVESLACKRQSPARA